MLKPDQPNPEFDPDIKYPDGWREILEAPDTADYRNWLAEMSELTKNQIADQDIWWDDDEIDTRWQMAIEVTANASIPDEDLHGLTQDQIIETGMVALQLNVESHGWEEEGLQFVVPDMFFPDNPQQAHIDLREFNVSRRHII